jgi:hypothetical protein
MKTRRDRFIGLTLLSALLSGPIGSTPAENAPVVSAPPTVGGATLHDGQRDFDWAVGSWNIHLKKLQHPLTGSKEWVEFDGTVVCHKIWDGRALVEEFNVDSPAQKIQIHGLALRLYNPQSRQWSIYWANANKGTMDFPPVTGEFTDGRGEFYDQESFDGRMIWVRYSWTNYATKAPHFEQAYSADGGKTWETNWITEQTRQITK